MPKTGWNKRRVVGVALLLPVMLPFLALILFSNLYTAEEDAEIFTDVTVVAGVDFLHHKRSGEAIDMGAGVVILDFNGDGLHDIYVTNSVGANALYSNDGDGTFTDVAASAGVDDPDARSNGGCGADYDNDGDQDLYLTNYGPSRLFRNSGDGTFVDVADAAGVVDTHAVLRSTGCAWGDYDRDGHLDFIVVRHLHEFEPTALALYHNNADGTFTNVTYLLGDIPGSYPLPPNDETYGNIWGAGYQPGWVDFDNDGDLDLYVVNDFGIEIHSNVLWRNDGPAPDGTWSFFDASIDSGADVTIYGMALAVGDYDLDGYLDMFVTNIRDNVLLRNNGDGRTFTNTMPDVVPDIAKIGRKDRVTWGATFLDYDNDGDEDLYVVSGQLGGPTDANARNQRNVLLRNRGDGTFAKVSSAGGADDPGIGHGAGYLDFNGDGCLDLYVANLGQPAKLFQNVCQSGNSWLTIKTVGTTSNRDGIGARITVVAGGKAQIREIASGASMMGQNMLEAHFGLGSVTLADSVTVRWPSGKVQTLTGVAVNQRLTITEPR